MTDSLDDIKQQLAENNKLKLKLKVIAGSRTNALEYCDDFLKVKIMQKPIEGKANKAIIDFLSKELKISKSKIVILNGLKSSIKTVELG